ncbi:MAG: NAD(P)/FAD-dependent oxidoreductase [Spirochaetes bacterium]|nr:NAD(P)/FAD-dependent oxidoreductase [Spirochaetota bacterium]
MKKVVIIGAGTAGTITANLLAKRAGKDVAITVVDADPWHYYQPGFLFIPFGMYTKEQVRREKKKYLPRGTEFILKKADHIDTAQKKITLAGGDTLSYDYLVIATGCDIVPEEIPGMSDGWRKNIFDYYTYEGSCALFDAMHNFTGGKLVVHVNEMPVKCPVAPLEFLFLADWFFTKRKTRTATSITFVTPLPGAFTKPVAAKKFGTMLASRNISMVSDFGTERIDAAAKKIVGYDGREVSYDLLVSIPTNMGSPLIEDSGLGDEFRFVPADNNTLQSKAHEDVFVIGDATNLPSSKAGAVAHFEAETLVENLLCRMSGKPLHKGFDGHSNCFIETGFNKAILIDFNYAQEPVEGRFPFPVIGPLSLLRESVINHLSKLAFEWIYWNMLLKAIPIPFIPTNMSLLGKKIPKQQ